MPVIQLDTNHVAFTFATDLHLAAHNPGKRKGSYKADLLDKLHQWCGITLELGAIGLCGGDVFHVKRPDSASNSFELVNEVIHQFSSFPLGRIFGIVGNHDVVGDNLATLLGQPLGTLISAGVYDPIGFLPEEDPLIFQSAQGLRVRVDGYNWMPGKDLLEVLSQQVSPIDVWQAHDVAEADYPWHYRIAMVHSFQREGKSGAMFDDFVLGHEDVVGTDYDAICYGHDHSFHGLKGYPKGPVHVQLGSLSRAALAVDEVNRDVSVAVLTFTPATGMEVTTRQLAVKPLEMAFHTADIGVEKVDTREDVVKFFGSLQQQVREVQSANPLEVLHTLTDDTDIITTIKDACELG